MPPQVPTEVLLAYQAKRLTPRRLRALGAFGSAIGSRISQRNQNKREPGEIGIRIFVQHKIRNLKNSDPRKVSKSEPFTYRGSTYEIPVDICEMAPAQPHGDTSSAFVRQRAGVGLPQASAPEFRDSRPGFIGGWAWDANRLAVVGISAEHVLGPRLGPVDGPIATATTAQIGTVRPGIRMRRPPKPNLMDCSLMDPGPETADTLLTIAPPIQAALSRQLLHWDINRPVVRRRLGGQPPIRGVIDQFSTVYTQSLDPKSNDNPLLVGQIGVYAEDGDFSNQGDSGSLVYLDDETEFGASKVLGLVIGAFPSSVKYPGRVVTAVTPMSVILSALGLETTATAPLFAFLDSLFDDEVRQTPFSLLLSAGRRGDKPQHPRSTERLVAALDAMNWARGIVMPMREHREVVLRSLVTDAELRHRATRALGPILAGKPTPDDVFNHVLSSDDVIRLGEFVTALGNVEEIGIESSVRVFQEPLKACQGRTIADLLRAFGPSRQDGTPEPATPRQTRPVPRA